MYVTGEYCSDIESTSLKITLSKDCKGNRTMNQLTTQKIKCVQQKLNIASCNAPQIIHSLFLRTVKGKNKHLFHICGKVDGYYAWSNCLT